MALDPAGRRPGRGIWREGVSSATVTTQHDKLLNKWQKHTHILYLGKSMDACAKIFSVRSMDTTKN